jgi:hypothetical protein
MLINSVEGNRQHRLTASGPAGVCCAPRAQIGHWMVRPAGGAAGPRAAPLHSGQASSQPADGTGHPT